MKGYNARYKPLINEKNYIHAPQMQRNNFYLVKEYTYVDGDNKRYNDVEAPIIYTLFVSRAKDIVHCVKVTNIRPDLIKKFFGKFFNKKSEALEMRGRSSVIYETMVKRVPIVTNDAYRTYKLSGIQRVMKLDVDVEPLVPKSKLLKRVEPKPKVRPKPKVQPKAKIEPKPKIEPKSSIKPKGKK
jgi:hypothetical protein